MLIVYASLILMILLWSLSFIVVDVAIEFIPPLSIALYRFIIASIAFILIDLYIKVRNKKKDDPDLRTSKTFSFTKKEWMLAILAEFTHYV